MIEDDANGAESGGGWAEPVTPFEAANYIHQISGEMATLAGGSSLPKLAAALNLARDLAAEAMSEHRNGKAS
jgi:hypothetical protein